MKVFTYNPGTTGLQKLYLALSLPKLSICGHLDAL